MTAKEAREKAREQHLHLPPEVRFTQRINDYEQAYSLLKKENTRLKGLLADVGWPEDRVNGELSKLKEENQQLREKIKELEAEIDELSSYHPLNNYPNRKGGK
jgi:peptidoglycan hydrolase CwlO-like protein